MKENLDRRGIKSLSFGFGVVAVPRLMLTGEFLMYPSNGENEGKKEAVIKRGYITPLSPFSHGFDEFPGGKVEKEHFHSSLNFQGACLNAMIDEIDQEVGVRPEAHQLEQVGKPFLVFQDRISKYVLFLVYPYFYDMDGDEMSKRHSIGKAKMISPLDYKSNIENGVIRPRPRDLPILTDYSVGYINTLM